MRDSLFSIVSSELEAVEEASGTLRTHNPIKLKRMVTLNKNMVSLNMNKVEPTSAQCEESTLHTSAREAALS